MKAQTYYRYGGPEVLCINDIPKPVPKKDEVLIKVKYAGIAAGDWHVLRGTPFAVKLMMGLLKPKNPVLGFEVSGSVEAVGSEVEDFKPGDEVLGELMGGGFAEYATVPSKNLAHKPQSVPFNIAAAIPVSGVTALQGVRDHGQVKKGDTVLIVGASGGVGSYAIQLAKFYGANVTAVVSKKSVSKIKPLVDSVIDYQDVLKGKKKYDVIIDAAAFRDYREYDAILKDSGKYILVGGSSKQLFRIMFFGSLMKKTFKNFLAKPNRKDLAFITDLIKKKKIKPLLDKEFTLEDVPKAIRHLEARKAVGKSVIRITS